MSTMEGGICYWKSQQAKCEHYYHKSCLQRYKKIHPEYDYHCFQCQRVTFTHLRTRKQRNQKQRNWNDEKQIDNRINDLGRAIIEELDLRQCPNPQCKMWIEKTGGCELMVCRCGRVFTHTGRQNDDYVGRIYVPQVYLDCILPLLCILFLLVLLSILIICYYRIILLVQEYKDFEDSLYLLIDSYKNITNEIQNYMKYVHKY